MLTSFVLAFSFAVLPSYPPANVGLFGDWREPSGAVIRIAPCGQRVCATLVAISPGSPETTDKMNPDHAARSHPLCGLLIGKDFTMQTDGHAEGGTLYDPKSGKTYHGEMTADGDTLGLRGYVGFKMFGRTETWTRTHQVSACSAQPVPGGA